MEDKRLPMTIEEATDFFEELYYGTHHFPNKIKAFGSGWSMNHFGDLSTYDGNLLTRLVFLAHDKCYRAEIQHSSSKYCLKICIWKRYVREGSIEKRHPTIETALDKWRETHPA
jgi:hypothetical protein